MEIRNGIYYPSAGHILQSGNSYMISSKDSSVSEIEVDESSIRGDAVGIHLGNLLVPCDLSKLDHKGLKILLISLVYSTDDQIAIMLNKEESQEDLERYNAMQAWREWSSVIARIVLNS
jgi:hypothetical protein